MGMGARDGWMVLGNRVDGSLKEGRFWHRASDGAHEWIGAQHVGRFKKGHVKAQGRTLEVDRAISKSWRARHAVGRGTGQHAHPEEQGQ
jgi:hypothetical protein